MSQSLRHKIFDFLFLVFVALSKPLTSRRRKKHTQKKKQKIDGKSSSKNSARRTNEEQRFKEDQGVTSRDLQGFVAWGQDSNDGPFKT